MSAMPLKSPDSVRALPRVLVLAVVLMTGGVGAIAQPHPTYSDVRLARLEYSNSSGEQGVTTFHYDRRGTLRRSFWTLLDGSRYSQGVHGVDEAGRQLTKHRLFSDGKTSDEEFHHDAAGLLRSESFSRSDGVAGTADYTHDETGRLRTMSCRKYKGWLDGDITFKHVDGRLASAVLTLDGRPRGTIDYRYDEAGHLRRAHWDFGGRWSQTFIYGWEPVPAVCYAAANPLMQRNTRYRVAWEEYDWNGGENGGPSTYRYGPQGELQEKVFTRADGLRTATTYVFDERGDLQTSHRRYHDERTADFRYRFDEQGRLKEKTFRRSDGATGSETYFYDELGHLERMEYQNMDFWLNGTVTLKHDARGHPVAGVFAGRDGYDAELDLDTDDFGNVTRIHWRFSFGKTQTYTFGYEPLGP